METIADFMGEDHDRLDGLFDEFRSTRGTDYSKACKLFLDFEAGLLRHIVWEEEILFPLFEERTGMRDSGPTAVMRAEHQEIKELLAKIHDAVLKGDTETGELEKEIIVILSAHNVKEENILYPWIDETLTEREIEETLAIMQDLPSPG